MAVLRPLALSLTLFLAPATASAQTRPINVPGPGTVAHYTPAGPFHLAVVTDDDPTPPRLALSSDRGRTFTDVPVDLTAGDLLDASVDADGRLWFVVSTRAFEPVTELRTRAPGGTEFVVAALPAGTQMTAPVAAYGTHYVAVGGSASVTLKKVTLAGIDPAGIDVPATAFPATRDVFTDDRGLWFVDGDRSWLVGPGDALTATPYVPDVALLGTGLRWLDRTLYRPLNAEVWREVPNAPDFNRLQPIDGGVLASSGAYTDAYSVVEGPFTDYGSRGNLAADTRALLETANAIRAQQGLPALIGDPLVSQASRNHAKYLLAHPGTAHSELAGMPGFTGATASERCAAVGATCGGEIAYSWPEPKDAVWGWWTTPLHRSIIGDPDQVAAGGGFARGGSGVASIINDAPGAAITVAPIGLPRGTWPGPLSFAGETPDPGAPCKLKPPYGVAATAYSYVDPASGARWIPGTLSLLDVTAKKPVGGCARGNYFLPAKALVAGHTYRGSTVYAAAEGGATRPFAWTFTAGATSCISIKAVRSTTVKRLRRGLTLRFSTCQAGRAKVQIIAGKSTVKGRATVPARAARFVTVTVKARVGRGTVLVPCDDAWRHRQRAHPRALKPVPAATT